MNEGEAEKELLKEMEREKFNLHNCAAYRWLIFNLLKIPDFPFIKELCVILSKSTGIPIYREHYRRKKACMYWFDKNLDQINKYIAENEVVIHCKEKQETIEIKLKPYAPKMI